MNSRSGADQTTEVDRQYSFVETGSSHPLPPLTDDWYENGERAYKINGRTTALADEATINILVEWPLPRRNRRLNVRATLRVNDASWPASDIAWRAKKSES
jgi:hypothetical protein